MSNHYFQIFKTDKGDISFSGDWDHNYDTFEIAADEFAKTVQTYTDILTDPPAKLDDAVFENDEFIIWVMKVPQFPFRIP